LWDRLQIISRQNFGSLHAHNYKHEEQKENTETVVDKNRKYNIESLQNESTKFLISTEINQ